MYDEVYCHECGYLVCQSCGCCAHVSCDNCSCPHVAQDREEYLHDRLVDSYEDGVCPDCGDVIPSDAVHGSSCNNCGHVFYDENFQDE